MMLCCHVEFYLFRMMLVGHSAIYMYTALNNHFQFGPGK